MVFENLYILLLWKKVASALEGLIPHLIRNEEVHVREIRFKKLFQLFATDTL